MAVSRAGEVWIFTLEDRHAYLDQRIPNPVGLPYGFGGTLVLEGGLLLVRSSSEGVVYVYEDLGAGFVERELSILNTAQC